MFWEIIWSTALGVVIGGIVTGGTMLFIEWWKNRNISNNWKKSLLVEVKQNYIFKENEVEDLENRLAGLKGKDVLIRVKAAGICGMDIHIFKCDYFSSYPIILWHEFSDVIEKVGDSITRFKPGENVTADPNNFCGNCFFCRQNLQNHCEKFKATGITYKMASAEYVVVPESSVFNIGSILFKKAFFT